MARCAGLLLLTASACFEIDPSYATGATTTATTTSATGSSTGAAGSGSSGGSSGGPVVSTNIAFVTSTAQTGDLGGLEGADAICNQLAGAAGLAGTYVAYLSDSTEGAIARLGSANGWVRTDGLPWARDQAALTSGRVAYPLLLTESGSQVGPAGVELVFTGTEASGMGATDHCADWQEGTNATSALGGFTDGGSSFWVSSAIIGCDLASHLYCLGVDVDEPVEIPDPGEDARLMFATVGTLAADAGRAAADALCATEAAAAGRGGMFLALMAEPGETLWERHDLSGGSWVRADGAVVLPIELGPAGWEQLRAPIVFDATGSVVSSISFWVGAGSTTETATADSTCDGWTDAAYPRRPIALTIYADWISPVNETPCDVVQPVVCLEQ